METYGTAGDYVLVVSHTGDTVQAAKRSVYRLLTRINIPNSPFWRVDIGDRLRKQLPLLQANGYATGMDFAPKKPEPKQEGERFGDTVVIYV